ncbi:hypothetical protein Q2941_26260 [Bradyrhizobium sp. UFLA05-153]
MGDEIANPIPADFDQRRKLWIYASLWLNDTEAPYASLSLQTLGYAERLILDMEGRLAVLAKDHASKKARDFLLSECSAHSVLWVFGLYEVLRTVRASRTPKFSPLASVFQKLEALRMPLAKHEVKSYHGTAPSHYPTSCWDIDSGQVGWTFYDPRLAAMRTLTRTSLSDEFLQVAAVRPDHLPPFPIGGPLGDFEG